MSRIPITTDADLHSLIGIQESEALEFKQERWGNGVEAAKDIAAMANAWGGNILLGVREEASSGAAIGFVSAGDAGAAPGVQQQLVQQLEHYLRPRDFVDRLTMRWLLGPGGERVLVVHVPAVALGCMAVADGEQRKGARFRFPVRVDRETRFMEFEEITRRLADPGRAVRIRLRELRGSPGARVLVRLSSPMFLLTSGGSFRLVREAKQPYDGELGQEHADAFAIEFCNEYRWASNAYDKLRHRELLVPYTLVRTLWRDAAGTLCVALRGCVEVAGDTIEVVAS